VGIIPSCFFIPLWFGGMRVEMKGREKKCDKLEESEKKKKRG